MSDFPTQHITLRGGRVVRIVHFGPVSSPDTAPTPAARDCEHHDGGPGICPSCFGELVYPVSWEERIGSRWRLALRCPDCEWRGEGEFDQCDLEVFDDELNDGTEALLMALRTFSRANMEADVERLISAINGDEIEPMDF